MEKSLSKVFIATDAPESGKLLSLTHPYYIGLEDDRISAKVNMAYILNFQSFMKAYLSLFVFL